MAKPFVTWKLTEDSKDYYFLAPENHYNGAVTGTNTGVTIASGTEAATYPLVKVEALLKSSVATRRKLSIRIGTGATAKRSTVAFVVATSKAETFDALSSGNYTTFSGQSATVVGTVEPLDASFS